MNKFSEKDIVKDKFTGAIGQVRRVVSANAAYDVLFCGQKHVEQALESNLELVTLQPTPYPPEVQSVLDAAVTRRQAIKRTLLPPTNALDAATDAYITTLTPPLDIEKLKAEMDKAAEYLLESAMTDGLHPEGGYDYGVKRRAYETALHQSEERGKAQEKAVRIAEATEELKRTAYTYFNVSYTPGPNACSETTEFFAAVAALQEAEGKS